MINIKEDEKLSVLNHSCAHLLAQAVQHLYPNAKFWVGPVISEGFYYDIDLGDKSITDEDLAKIEKENDIKAFVTINKEDAIEKAKEIDKKIEEENDREIYYFLLGNYNNIAPKSFGGFRKMKNSKSDNYIKLVDTLLKDGYKIEEVKFWN